MATGRRQREADNGGIVYPGGDKAKVPIITFKTREITKRNLSRRGKKTWMKSHKKTIVIKIRVELNMLIRVGILCNVRFLPHCAHYVLLWSACNCDSFYGLEMCFINTLAKRCVKAPRTRRHFAAETPLTLFPCLLTSLNTPSFLLLPSPTCFSFTNECVWLKRQPKEMMHRAMYTDTHTHTYIAIGIALCLCFCVCSL